MSGRKISIAVCALVILAPGCASRTIKAAPTSSAGSPDTYFTAPVPIGVKADQPGFSTDSNGVYAGFDIDLAHYLADQLKFARDSFQTVDDLNRASALGTRVRLVIATYSITSDREAGTGGDPPVDDALYLRERFSMAKRDPVSDRGHAAFAQAARNHRSLRSMRICDDISSAEVGGDASGDQAFVGDGRETFFEPFVPAQHGEPGTGLSRQLELLRGRQADKSVRPGGEARLGGDPSGGGRRPCRNGHSNFSHRTPPPYLMRSRFYLPLKFALRFSVNALMPSSASSETKIRPIASRSNASPRSIGPP